MRPDTVIAQILRRDPMKRLVNHQADLKLNAKRDWQPVQNITEEWRDMIVLPPVA